MKRVFPAHAYSAVPRAGCYWQSTIEIPDYPTAQGEIRCDVVVIGAGFTGLSAALHLAEAGHDVAIVDTHHPGWGASGRNGGFCCLGGSAASDTILAKLFGEDARRSFRDTEVTAVDCTRDLIEKHGIDCDRHSDGETLMAHTQKAMEGFEGYAEKIQRDYGVSARITPKANLTEEGMNGPFFGAITNPIGFALNPLKYTLGLANAAIEAGVRIFGGTRILRIDHGFTLYSDAAQISSRRLVIATNGYSSDDLPEWLAGRYLPTQSNVIVTRPFTDEELATQGWTTHQMCYDDRFFLHYFRLMPNKQMLFGMRGGLFSSHASDRRMHRTIRTHFERMFPAWTNVETPYSWHGLLSIAADLTPYAGPIPEMPGAYTAISYHGNGVAMASYAGRLLAELVDQKVPKLPYPDIMKSPPRRFPLAGMRRATIWPLYAMAILRGD